MTWEEFGTLDSSEKTIAILGDRWWPQTVKARGDKICKKKSDVTCGRNVLSVQGLEVSLSGVGTVLRLERDGQSMVE